MAPATSSISRLTASWRLTIPVISPTTSTDPMITISVDRMTPCSSRHRQFARRFIDRSPHFVRWNDRDTPTQSDTRRSVHSSVCCRRVFLVAQNRRRFVRCGVSGSSETAFIRDREEGEPSSPRRTNAGCGQTACCGPGTAALSLAATDSGRTDASRVSLMTRPEALSQTSGQYHHGRQNRQNRSCHNSRCDRQNPYHPFKRTVGRLVLLCCNLFRQNRLRIPVCGSLDCAGRTGVYRRAVRMFRTLFQTLNGSGGGLRMTCGGSSPDSAGQRNRKPVGCRPGRGRSGDRPGRAVLGRAVSVRAPPPLRQDTAEFLTQPALS